MPKRPPGSAACKSGMIWTQYRYRTAMQRRSPVNIQRRGGAIGAKGRLVSANPYDNVIIFYFGNANATS